MPMKMDLTPDSLDLVLYAGDRGDFQIDFIDDNSIPINVSSWVWTAQIRKSRESSTHIDLTIDVTKAVQGSIIVNIPKEVTRSLGDNTWDKTSQWDIQCVTGGGDPLTVLQGTVSCNMDVTR